MKTTPDIPKRDGVNPSEGEHRYGDVNGPVVRFADPTNKKYPIGSLGHIRTAWSYHIDAEQYDVSINE